MYVASSSTGPRNAMTLIEKSCCVVTVSDPLCDQRPVSCSGVIINYQTGMVICHGLAFSCFIDDKVLVSAEHGFLLPRSFRVNPNINIHFPEQRDQDTNQCSEKVSTVDQTQNKATAKLCMLVNCPQFAEAFDTTFKKSDKWRFFYDDGGDDDVTRDSPFLSWFAVIHVDFAESAKTFAVVPCAQSRSLHKGCQVIACGSPFGALCPDLFINTLSRGIVSNLSGKDNAVILTDARCLPGTEGGGLFLPKANCVYLVGIIVSPLCWKSNEWIGLSLICSFQLILRNVLRCMNVQDPRRQYVHQVATGFHSPSLAFPSHVEKYPTICFIDSGQFWGSGVAVTSRLVLTCRHVVDRQLFVRLKFYHSDRFHDVVGDVLFSTMSSSPYDVALVELRDSFPAAVVPQMAQSFQPGEDVVVMGYGGLGQSCGPSLTSGILSKSIIWNFRPVMLQTTCAVQAGSSGGAVVRADSGELLGIVSSNTRDFAAKVTYPHLNFSIPITLLHPLLQRFHQTRDADVFRALDTTEEGVQLVWRLQGAQSKL